MSRRTGSGDKARGATDRRSRSASGDDDNRRKMHQPLNSAAMQQHLQHENQQMSGSGGRLSVPLVGIGSAKGSTTASSSSNTSLPLQMRKMSTHSVASRTSSAGGRQDDTASSPMNTFFDPNELHQALLDARTARQAEKVFISLYSFASDTTFRSQLNVFFTSEGVFELMMNAIRRFEGCADPFGQAIRRMVVVPDFVPTVWKARGAIPMLPVLSFSFHVVLAFEALLASSDANAIKSFVAGGGERAFLEYVQKLDANTTTNFNIHIVASISMFVSLTKHPAESKKQQQHQHQQPQQQQQRRHSDNANKAGSAPAAKDSSADDAKDSNTREEIKNRLVELIEHLPEQQLVDACSKTGGNVLMAILTFLESTIAAPQSDTIFNYTLSFTHVVIRDLYHMGFADNLASRLLMIIHNYFQGACAQAQARAASQQLPQQPGSEDEGVEAAKRRAKNPMFEMIIELAAETKPTTTTTTTSTATTAPTAPTPTETTRPQSRESASSPKRSKSPRPRRTSHAAAPVPAKEVSNGVRNCLLLAMIQMYAVGSLHSRATCVAIRVLDSLAFVVNPPQPAPQPTQQSRTNPNSTSVITVTAQSDSSESPTADLTRTPTITATHGSQSGSPLTTQVVVEGTDFATKKGNKKSSGEKPDGARSSPLVPSSSSDKGDGHKTKTEGDNDKDHHHSHHHHHHHHPHQKDAAQATNGALITNAKATPVPQHPLSPLSPTSLSIKKAPAASAASATQQQQAPPPGPPPPQKRKLELAELSQERTALHVLLWQLRDKGSQLIMDKMLSTRTVEALHEAFAAVVAKEQADQHQPQEGTAAGAEKGGVNSEKQQQQQQQQHPGSSLAASSSATQQQQLELQQHQQQQQKLALLAQIRNLWIVFVHVYSHTYAFTFSRFFRPLGVFIDSGGTTEKDVKGLIGWGRNDAVDTSLQDRISKACAQQEVVSTEETTARAMLVKEIEASLAVACEQVHSEIVAYFAQPEILETMQVRREAMADHLNVREGYTKSLERWKKENERKRASAEHATVKEARDKRDKIVRAFNDEMEGIVWDPDELASKNAAHANKLQKLTRGSERVVHELNQFSNWRAAIADRILSAAVNFHNTSDNIELVILEKEEERLRGDGWLSSQDWYEFHDSIRQQEQRAREALYNTESAEICSFFCSLLRERASLLFGYRFARVEQRCEEGAQRIVLQEERFRHLIHLAVQDVTGDKKTASLVQALLDEDGQFTEARTQTASPSLEVTHQITTATSQPQEQQQQQQQALAQKAVKEQQPSSASVPETHFANPHHIHPPPIAIPGQPTATAGAATTSSTAYQPPLNLSLSAETMLAIFTLEKEERERRTKVTEGEEQWRVYHYCQWCNGVLHSIAVEEHFAAARLHFLLFEFWSRHKFVQQADATMEKLYTKFARSTKKKKQLQKQQQQQPGSAGDGSGSSDPAIEAKGIASFGSSLLTTSDSSQLGSSSLSGGSLNKPGSPHTKRKDKVSPGSPKKKSTKDESADSKNDGGKPPARVPSFNQVGDAEDEEEEEETNGARRKGTAVFSTKVANGVVETGGSEREKQQQEKLQRKLQTLQGSGSRSGDDTVTSPHSSGSRSNSGSVSLVVVASPTSPDLMQFQKLDGASGISPANTSNTNTPKANSDVTSPKNLESTMAPKSPSPAKKESPPQQGAPSPSHATTSTTAAARNLNKAVQDAREAESQQNAIVEAEVQKRARLFENESQWFVYVFCQHVFACLQVLALAEFRDRQMVHLQRDECLRRERIANFYDKKIKEERRRFMNLRMSKQQLSATSAGVTTGSPPMTSPIENRSTGIELSQGAKPFSYEGSGGQSPTTSLIDSTTSREKMSFSLSNAFSMESIGDYEQIRRGRIITMYQRWIFYLQDTFHEALSGHNYDFYADEHDGRLRVEIEEAKFRKQVYSQMERDAKRMAPFFALFELERQCRGDIRVGEIVDMHQIHVFRPRGKKYRPIRDEEVHEVARMDVNQRNTIKNWLRGILTNPPPIPSVPIAASEQSNSDEEEEDEGEFISLGAGAQLPVLCSPIAEVGTGRKASNSTNGTGHEVKPSSAKRAGADAQSGNDDSGGDSGCARRKSGGTGSGGFTRISVTGPGDGTGRDDGEDESGVEDGTTALTTTTTDKIDKASPKLMMQKQQQRAAKALAHSKKFTELLFVTQDIEAYERNQIMNYERYILRSLMLYQNSQEVECIGTQGK